MIIWLFLARFSHKSWHSIPSSIYKGFGCDRLNTNFSKSREDYSKSARYIKWHCYLENYICATVCVYDKYNGVSAMCRTIELQNLLFSLNIV